MTLKYLNNILEYLTNVLHKSDLLLYSLSFRGLADIVFRYVISIVVYIEGVFKT